MAKSRKGPGKQRDSKLGILGYRGHDSKGMQFDNETEVYSPQGVGFGTQFEDLDESEPRYGRQQFGKRKTAKLQDENEDGRS